MSAGRALQNVKGSNSETSVANGKFSDYPCLGVHYEVQKVIGNGAYSRVYQAQHRRTKNIVAIKKLKETVIQKLPEKEWKKEVNVLSQINHPNIMRFIDIMTSSNQGSIFFVFEYCHLTFYQLLQMTSVPNQRIKYLMKNLLVGVEYIHSRNIIHRDLKPSNVLINARGIVKIGDFGQSIVASSPVIEKVRGERFGTRFYKSIEILLGSQTYTNAIDLWSVGCLFAEIIRGSTIFPYCDIKELLIRIFDVCGTPSETEWPGVHDLSGMQIPDLPMNRKNNLIGHLYNRVTEASAYNLLLKLLKYCPSSRISAEDALQHEYFTTGERSCGAPSMARWLRSIINKDKDSGL